LIYGAGFAAGAAVDPVVAEFAPCSCVIESVEATCVREVGPNKAPKYLFANEPSLSAQGTGGSRGN